ncbi:hypothetical protein [Anaeromyxobacter diazotrophicus]|uniref:hypothetical protein n=1 Tax=Anaeromyxobacter diazotrophicus TaxID=2590199 RepID=UPI001591098C|nr:hypothetical protein [Anaeromyxobacter diazotrophicus]
MDWAAQAALFEREAKGAATPAAAAALLFEAGRLRAEHLGDRDGAEALWRAAAQADPGFGPAARADAQAAEERARALGHHDDRIRALERCAELSAPAAAAPLLAAAAAVAEERLERPALAADLALRAFDLAPGDAALRREARRHAEREGRDASLARVLEAEASDEATSPREAGLALCALARLLSGPLDDAAEARARLLAARRRGGDDPIVLDTLAALHEERGEWELAAEALRARAATQAGTPGEVVELVAGHLRLAEICEERLARADGAVAGYRAVLALAPGHRGALAALGRLFARAEDWEHLLETFLAERDAAADPREKAHRAFKAGEVLEERLARPDEAVERYREALAQDPALCAARQGLERLYASLGRHADLAALLEDGLEGTAAPEERIALLIRLARLHEDRLADPGTAARAWERVLELAPQHAVALRALSGLYDRIGRFADLVQVNERLLGTTQDPRAAIALLQRTAEAQEEPLADPDAARLTLERILALDPSHRPALRALGRLYARSGRWTELVRMCRAEAEVAPSAAAAADLQFRAAEILERQLGDEAEALAGYREVLTLAPEHLGALAALARLHRARGAWESLVEVLRAQAAVRGAPERRAELLADVADLWETRLAEPAHAVEVHLEALAEVPAYARSLRALDRLLAAAGRHGELAALLRAQAAAAHGPARTAALLRAARLHAERLGDRAAALDACRAALASAPEDPSARLLAAELEGLSGVAALGASGDDLQAGLRAAEEHEAAGRLEQAAEVLHRTLVANPGALPAVCALARVATRRGELAEARNALRSQAALLADDGAAAAALDEAGELSRRLGDPAGAAADWTAALARAPARAEAGARLAALLREAADPAALLGGEERAFEAAGAAALAAPERGEAFEVRARLHAAAGRHAEAARDLTTFLGLGGPAPQLEAAHLELAALYDGPLADPARAVSHLQAVLASAPGDASALQRLAALHARAENWPGAADALRRLLALPDLAAPERCTHLLALAELRATRFGDLAAARALYEEARRLAPDDGRAAAALAEQEAPGEPVAPAVAQAGPAAGALLEEQRRLLAQDPGRVESWRALFRLFHAARAVDSAFVVAGVLRFLQPSEPEPGGAPAAERAPPAQAPAPGRALSEADWARLRHPADRGPLSEILALAADALCEVAQLPAPSRGRERPPAALERLVEETCRALALRPFPLRAGGEGAGLTLLPGEPVVAFAGPELTARFGPSEQRFLVARAAARVRARSALADRLSAAALRELLSATVRLIAPEDTSLGVPAEALARAVARAVPRKVRKALEEPVHALLVSGAPEVAEWQEGLAATAGRAGLLVAGDVPAALALVLAEGAPAAGRADRAAAARDLAPLRDLLLFAASDEHLRLRQRLGLAVAPVAQGP